MHLDKEEEIRGQLKQKNTQHKISLINPIQIKKIDLDFPSSYNVFGFALVSQVKKWVIYTFVSFEI
jgi:hypothetical protein